MYIWQLIQISLQGECLHFHRLPYILLVLFSLGVWCGLYWLFKWHSPEHRSEWHCRVVTMIHGLFSCTFCLYILVIDWRIPFYWVNQGRASTHLMQVAFSISLAYFIFDLVWSVSHNSESGVMLFHHLCSILGFSVALMVGRWGTELTATTLGSELSNPLLQTRWFLREALTMTPAHSSSNANNGSLSSDATAATNNDTRSIVPPPWYSKLQTAVDILFILFFGFNRLILGSYFLYTYFTNPKTDFLGRLGAFVIYSIGWIFWVSICNFIQRKLRKLCSSSAIRTGTSGLAAGDSPEIDSLLPPEKQRENGGGFESSAKFSDCQSKYNNYSEGVYNNNNDITLSSQQSLDCRKRKDDR